MAILKHKSQGPPMVGVGRTYRGTSLLRPAISDSRVPGVTYRVTSPIRSRNPLGPYRRPMPRVRGGSYGGGCFLWARYPCTGPNASG